MRANQLKLPDFRVRDTTVSTGQWGGRRMTLISSPKSARFDWHYLPEIQTPEDLAAQPMLREGLAEILSELDIRKAYLLCRPRDHTTIARTSQFPSGIQLTDQIYLFPSKTYAGVMLDEPGEAVITATAGDPLLVAAGCNYCVVAVANLHSLIDRRLVETGHPADRHESLVYAIAHAIAQKHGGRGILRYLSLKAFYTMAGSPYEIADDDLGAISKTCLDYVQCRWGSKNLVRLHEPGARLHLGALIRSQAREIGFKPDSGYDHVLRYEDRFSLPRHPRPELASSASLGVVQRL